MSEPVAIVANGFADGPAQALRDYFVGRGEHVLTVFHPLTREQGTAHHVTLYDPGQPTSSRTIDVRALRPPLSYAADPFVPFRLPRVGLWFGFNPLACARGLAQRRRGRAEKVVLWSVDFVPSRFGRTPLTSLYDRLDRYCCTHVDARVELSEAAREARDRHHRLDHVPVPTRVVPMGAWLERTPVVQEDAYARKRIVFLGHLVPRQGVATLIEAFGLLRARDGGYELHVVGTGPEEAALRQQARSLGLGEAVRFHGYVADHADVERLLAGSSVAVAPYEPSETTFTRHADPGKLKAYLAAGLPTILTDVPPNARDLAEHAGAELVAFDPEKIAEAVAALLRSPEQWRERSRRAREYMRRFDWPALFDEALADLGLR